MAAAVTNCQYVIACGNAQLDSTIERDEEKGNYAAMTVGATQCRCRYAFFSAKMAIKESRRAACTIVLCRLYFCRKKLHEMIKCHTSVAASLPYANT